MDMTRIIHYLNNLHLQKPDNKLRSLLIARDNKLVLEAYFNGWTRDRKQDIRSATKSFTSCLIGMAIDHQLIPDEKAKILDFFPEYSSFQNWDNRKAEMTIQDFLQMRTGLACNDWSPDSPGNEENMSRTGDWVKFILDLPVATQPGNVFNYCTGAPVTLGALLGNVLDKSVEEFAHEKLFEPLGITDYTWGYKPDRTIDTGGHLHIKPRDMLKFGLMFLGNGSWEGHQLVSPEWVKRSTESNGAAGGHYYGYLWWVTRWELEDRVINAYFANGNGGQLIFVLPELNAVVVMTGGQYGENWMPARLSLMGNVILPAFQ
jgi:CubicO group peptidase (beta-lactamase class C family)